jgi:hypothetical protein
MADNYVDNNYIDANRNRAYDTRRDTDSFKTPSITLYDIDYAVLYFLKEKINFQIEENGRMITVPVMYAGGETWSQIQRHGYLRDKTRKILTPIIVLRRSGLLEDDRFSQLDVRGPLQSKAMILRPNRQVDDPYDQYQETDNSTNNFEFYATVLPTMVKVTYDVFIWTELQTQLNSIVEKIIPQNRLSWGDSYQFTTKFGDVAFETLNDTGNDRIIRASLQLEVDGRLRESYELFESDVIKAHSIKRLVFENEVEQTEIYPDHKPKIIRIAKSRIPNSNLE